MTDRQTDRQSVRQSYYYVDLLKLICSILIVISHCLPVFNNVVDLYYGQWFFRFAVPFFFLVTGYLLKTENIDKAIKRISTLYLSCTIIYLPLILSVRGSVLSTIYTLIFGYRHLWYLSATIIALTMLWIFRQVTDNKKTLLIVSCMLYILGIIVNSYLPIINKELALVTKNILVLIGTQRHGVLLAFPLIVFGYLLKDIKASVRKCIAFLMLLIPLSFVENVSILKINSELKLDNTFIMPLISIVLLLVCVSMSGLTEIYKQQNGIILRKMSIVIYELHIWILVILDKLMIIFNLDNSILKCGLTIIFSVILSYIIVSLSKHFKLFKLLM